MVFHPICNEYDIVVFMKVIWDKDLAEDSPLPWYLPLDPSRFSLSSFRLTTVGRIITRNMVSQ
jgi:sterol 24-C-methyltransferase